MPPGANTNRLQLTDNNIAAAQTSYDSTIIHFAKLIQLLSKQPGYKPANTELTVAALGSLLNNMLLINAGVVNAYTAWSHARIERNKTLYNPLAGLTHAAMDIKLYARSFFAARSLKYKRISKLSFSSL